METIEYRFAEPNDFDGVKELMLQALQTDPTAFSISYEEYKDKDDYWWHGYIDPFLYKNLQEFIVAVNKGKIIGSSGLVFENKERKKHTSLLSWFYVTPEFRHSGIGTKLLEKIIELAKERNLSKISLMANQEQDSAINLYKRYGFAISGKLEKELNINGKFYDVILMEKFLN